jgi:hypothetical protein
VIESFAFIVDAVVRVAKAWEDLFKRGAFLFAYRRDY